MLACQLLSLLKYAPDALLFTENSLHVILHLPTCRGRGIDVVNHLPSPGAGRGAETAESIRVARRLKGALQSQIDVQFVADNVVDRGLNRLVVVTVPVLECRVRIKRSPQGRDVSTSGYVHPCMRAHDRECYNDDLKGLHFHHNLLTETSILPSGPNANVECQPKAAGEMGGLCQGESKIIWNAWSRTNNIHWHNLQSQGEDERFKCESTMYHTVPTTTRLASAQLLLSLSLARIMSPTYKY
jgi:hypothetical protein